MDDRPFDRFDEVFEAAPLAMWVAGEDRRLLRVNRAFRLLLGYSEDELIGRSICEFTERQGGASHERSDSLVEDRFLTKGNQVILLRLSIAVIPPSDGRAGYRLGTAEDITARHEAEQKRERLISELRAALANVRTLRGLLPICSRCKKIRDDAGYWKQIDQYLAATSELQFSHGYCPECVAIEFPQLRSAQGAARSRIVLVVEDEDDIAEEVVTLLEDHGYDVPRAPHGRAALELLRDGLCPDLILLDLVMHTMDGWEFREVQRREPAWAEIPVVLMSASPNVRSYASQLGAAAHIAKPFRSQKLLQLLESLIPSGRTRLK